MFILVTLFSVSMAYAGITGKIAGVVVDAENGEPLPGANITIEGTTIGAASDLTGFSNIAPIEGNWCIVVTTPLSLSTPCTAPTTASARSFFIPGLASTLSPYTTSKPNTSSTNSLL